MKPTREEAREWLERAVLDIETAAAFDLDEEEAGHVVETEYQLRKLGGIAAILAALTEPQAQPAPIEQRRVSDPSGGLVIACDRCGHTLTQPGALHFTPPDSLGMVRKLHVCVTCEQRGTEPQALSGERLVAFASPRGRYVSVVTYFDGPDKSAPQGAMLLFRRHEDAAECARVLASAVVRVKPSEVE